MNGSIPPFPHMPLWPTRGQRYVCVTNGKELSSTVKICGKCSKGLLEIGVGRQVKSQRGRKRAVELVESI